MSGLERHLTATSHDGLAFHPSCPTCRALRLEGTLPAGAAVVGPRARAGVLAAVLAGSSLVPAAAAVARTSPSPAPAATQDAGSDPIGGNEDPIDDETDDPA